MTKLNDEIRSIKFNGIVVKSRFLYKAKIPILKLVVDLQGLREKYPKGTDNSPIAPRVLHLKVDITLEEPEKQPMEESYNSANSHLGIQAVTQIKHLIHQREQIRPIVMIIKKMIEDTTVSLPFYGGINSYSLVLMVSAFLKKFDPHASFSHCWNLMGFFKYFG